MRPPKDLERQERPLLLRIPFSHYCRKVEWALTHAGIPYDALDISLPKMKQMERANPAAGTVPVLLVDGGLLFGSQTIVAWADRNRTPGAEPLFPDDLEAEVASWCAWADDEVGPVARREAYRAAYNEPWDFTGHRMLMYLGLRVVRPVVLAVLKYTKARRFEAHDAEAVPRIIARIDDRLAASGGPYLFGERSTAADLAVAALVAPLRLAGAAHGHLVIPGWSEVVGQYVRDVRPDATLLQGSRRIREQDWAYFEAIDRATVDDR